jgi:hypothetical protein
MTHDASNTRSGIPAGTVESFLALSRIYLTSSERLVALNMAALREMLADAAPALRSPAGKTSATGLEAFTDSLSMFQVNRALAYCRGLQDIAAQAQDEFVHVLLNPAPAPQWRQSMPNAWPSILAAFARAPAPAGKGNGGAGEAAARRQA